jgi:adenosylcobinamide kinase/adenosylcobinamide-phosphate guanylyltransferase
VDPQSLHFVGKSHGLLLDLLGVIVIPVVSRKYEGRDMVQSEGASFGKSLFVLGGARSGKSRHAQDMAEALAKNDTVELIYIATAQAFDGEMTDRIARHRSDRDDRWQTVEAPLALAEALLAADARDTVMLVDCLTLWVSNLLLADVPIAARIDALLHAIGRLEGRVIIVSNEVGLGIVPDNALARRFRDATGMLHQRIASSVESVDIVMAGLVQRWKAPLRP